MFYQEVLKVLNFFLRLSGLSYFFPFRFKLMRYFVLFLNLLILLATFVWPLLSTEEREELIILSGLVEYVLLMVNIATVIVIFTESFAKENLKKSFYMNLRLAEDVIGKYRASAKNHKFSFVKPLRAISIVLRVFLITFPHYEDESSNIWDILYYSVVVMILFSTHYETTIQHVTKIYEAIDELVEISEIDFKMINSISKQILEEDFFIEIISCQNSLNNCLENINKRFGPSIFMVISSCFTCITYTSFHFFIELETAKHWNLVLCK